MSRFRERLAELRVDGEEDHIRKVASQVMRDAIQAVAEPEAAGALFAACDALSTETYERTETNGTLLLCGRGPPSVEVLLEMTKPVPLRSTRAARKLLQMGRAGVEPLSDVSTIWGLGRVVAPSERSCEDLFEVRFTGRSRWEFRQGGECLFVVENRRPMLSHTPLARDRRRSCGTSSPGRHLGERVRRGAPSRRTGNADHAARARARGPKLVAGGWSLTRIERAAARPIPLHVAVRCEDAPRLPLLRAT